MGRKGHEGEGNPHVRIRGISGTGGKGRRRAKDAESLTLKLTPRLPPREKGQNTLLCKKK